MPTKLFSGDSVSGKALAQLGADTLLKNRRFVARNFALDENVSTARAHEYQNIVGQISTDDMETWQSNHWSYLSSRIYKGAGEAYTFDGEVDRSDPECPASFRDPFAFIDYAAADEQLEVLRVETAAGVANIIAFDGGEKFRITRRLIALSQQAGPRGVADAVAARGLDRELRTWSRYIDRRPAFVTWAGLFDGELFDNDPGNDAPDWPDELRDRLGLSAIEAGETLIVFRYAIADLPRFTDDPTVQPLVVPTVIDFSFCDAFCPAPRNRASGNTVDLAGRGRLQSEILHPGLRLEAKHLFRIGNVTRSPTADLTSARATHFGALRVATGRPDYGLATEI